MKPFISLLFAVAVCGPLTAWSRPGRAASYTEDDVRTFVLPGTSRQAILNRFGAPTSQEKNPKFEDGSTEVEEIFHFMLPPPTHPAT